MKRGQRGFPSAPGGGFGFSSAASAGSLSYLAEPPSFAVISDPNVVVSLKNVLKKDSTTKAKGLEDLIQYAQTHPFEQDGGVEEALLDIWTQVYARISIDNSRRVRELSHALQSELLRSARKRMERHVPKVVGPWLAGLYDRDRVVARAARDGISSFLTTPEKLTAFWVKCQPQILDFACEAIRETQDTLSDERSTTSEDAEAKYYRVVTSSLSLVMGLLQRVDDEGLKKVIDKYDEYFNEEIVWKTITLKDSTVRKTVCQLLFICLDRKLPYATSTKVMQAFVTGGLKSSQAGSALEYVRALTKLTQQNASFWSSASNEKKSPVTRLQSFISKGSQGSPPKFWEALDQLLALIPADTLGLDMASNLLISVKAGITNREEPRTSTSYSWKCFIDVAKRSMSQLPNDAKLVFAQEHLFPLLEQFLFSTSETSTIPTGPNAMSIFVEAHLAAIQSSSEVVQASAEEWNRLSTMLCTNISGSLPEVSKDYKSSQSKIAEQGRRWFALVGQIFPGVEENGSSSLPDQTSSPSARIICQCVSLLESRNMKPFGAAQIVEYALSTSRHLFNGDNGKRLAIFLRTAAEDGIDKVATSASANALLSCLGIFGAINNGDVGYQEIWRLWMKESLQLADQHTRNSMLTGLLSQENAAFLSRESQELQETLYSQSLAILDSQSEAWDMLETAVIHQTMSEEMCHRLGVELVDRLSKSIERPDPVLRMIEMLARSKPTIFSQGPLHTELVAQLLSSSEIEDVSTSSKAAAILSILNAESRGKLPVVEIVQASLERASAQSLGIPTLVSQAKSAIKSGVASWEEILPNTNVWMSQLAAFLDSPINPVLSITSNIGGAVSIPRAVRHNDTVASIARDRDGRSVPLRMAMYTSELLGQDVESLQLPLQFQIEVLFLQCLIIQLASDQMDSMTKQGLWLTLDDEAALAEAEEIIMASRSLLKKFIVKAEDWASPEQSADSPSLIIWGLLELTMKESREMSPQGAYSARVLSELLQSLIETHGVPSTVEEKYLKLENLKAKPDTALVASGLVSGLGDAVQSSKALSNFCNRLVSEVAAMSPEDERAELTLVLVALTAQVYETGDLPVTNNRIVFAVRQITSWLGDSSSFNSSFSATICRALDVLLPCMTEVYGSYWETALQFCSELWTRAASVDLNQALPFVHASIKLVRALESIAEPNDDLADALRDFSATKSKGLIELLRIDRPAYSQSLEIVDGMLCREIDKIAISRIPEPQELFGLISSESRHIQTAAFNLLHKKLPADQQQKSIDALLDKTDALLPDELLSLFLDPPSLDSFSDEALSAFPSSIRGYLLSWKLVFDAYGSSQYKIRDDYTQHLKTEKLVAPLLNFMFDVLGHSVGQPLNLDKENIGLEQICEYDVKLAESETGEQSLHWLLVHLYYLTLKFIPGLFRAWYIDCRSKQTKIAVESWTTKYFSPVIVRETLDSVEAWVAEQQPASGGEKELLVKVSKAAREVTAGYEVDESQAAIVIKVPASYPIDGVTVSSLNRVAVNERKWQSWIMTTQGAITLANGSIIDGLQVFKRNIMAALQGQSECAICYSMISEDKRMPDKKCTTCNNLFHRSCLYKWFQTSNQNSCPLCRNPIDYLGADTARRRQQ